MPLIADRIDLELDADNELVIDGDLQFSAGAAAVAQSCRLALQAFMGEWFLDLDDGVPYFQSILGRRYDATKTVQAFREPLLAVQSVESIVALASAWDGATRELTISWEVMTEFGDTVADSLPVAT